MQGFQRIPQLDFLDFPRMDTYRLAEAERHLNRKLSGRRLSVQFSRSLFVFSYPDRIVRDRSLG